jgi:hypothetical protein
VIELRGEIVAFAVIAGWRHLALFVHPTTSGALR